MHPADEIVYLPSSALADLTVRAFHGVAEHQPDQHERGQNPRRIGTRSESKTGARLTGVESSKLM